jgi:hypothetical protein
MPTSAATSRRPVAHDHVPTLAGGHAIEKVAHRAGRSNRVPMFCSTMYVSVRAHGLHGLRCGLNKIGLPPIPLWLFGYTRLACHHFDASTRRSPSWRNSNGGGIVGMDQADHRDCFISVKACPVCPRPSLAGSYPHDSRRSSCPSRTPGQPSGFQKPMRLIYLIPALSGPKPIAAATSA